MSIPIDAKAMAFLVTADRARAKAFYRDVLGFAVVEEDEFAVVFDLHGTMLRMSDVASHAAPSHAVLGWEVQDLAGTVGELVGKGVAFIDYGHLGQDERGIWQVPGRTTTVAWFADPDRNILSLTQF